MLMPRESAQSSSRWMLLFLWRSPLMIKQGWPCYWELHKSLLAEGFWLSRLEGRQKNQKMQDVLYMWRLPMGLCNNITIAKTPDGSQLLLITGLNLFLLYSRTFPKLAVFMKQFTHFFPYLWRVRSDCMP